MAASSSTPTPTVAGPLTGGTGEIQPPNVSSLDLDQVGYRGSEYTISGTATAYAPNPDPLTSDGLWNVTPSSTAPYTSRVVVFRPKKAAELQRLGRRRMAQRVGRARRRPGLDA